MKRAMPPFLEFHRETSNESQKDAIIEALALLTDIIDEEIAYFDGENEVKVVLDSMKELFWNAYTTSEKNDVQRKRVCMLAIRNMIVRPPTSYIVLSEVNAMLETLGNSIILLNEEGEDENESLFLETGGREGVVEGGISETEEAEARDAEELEQAAERDEEFQKDQAKMAAALQKEHKRHEARNKKEKSAQLMAESKMEEKRRHLLAKPKNRPESCSG